MPSITCKSNVPTQFGIKNGGYNCFSGKTKLLRISTLFNNLAADKEISRKPKLKGDLRL
jgi:hypothetical protein